MKRSFRWPFILVISLSFYSCEKEQEAPFVEAVIIDSGSPSVDGCGWLIKTEDNTYSPTNLAEQYESSDQKKVLIQFNLLDEFFCDWWGGEGYQKIQITNIKHR